MFPQVYRSIVVLANPKTILNDKKAPKEVRDIVIRSDQLVSYIKRLEEADDLYRSPESEMRDLMDSFLKCGLPNQEDYVQKFEKMLHQSSPEKVEKGDSEKLPDSPKKCPDVALRWFCGLPKAERMLGTNFGAVLRFQNAGIKNKIREFALEGKVSVLCRGQIDRCNRGILVKGCAPFCRRLRSRSFR